MLRLWNLPKDYSFEMLTDIIDDLDLQACTQPQLSALMERAEELYDDLQNREPEEDMASEAYALWLDAVEALDDLIDEIRDLQDD